MLNTKSSAGVGGRVWKEEEKNHLTPALGQEWKQGNVFFPFALSVFSIRWYYLSLVEDTKMGVVCPLF